MRPGPSITHVPPSAPAESGCSDEFALDCTFAACDPERTGSRAPWGAVAELPGAVPEGPALPGAVPEGPARFPPGLVRPQRVVQYVAAMTGHSGHHGRLRALRRALDPANAGTELDWSRFRAAMGAWIAACRQDGSARGEKGQRRGPAGRPEGLSRGVLSLQGRGAGRRDWGHRTGASGCVLGQEKG